MGEGDLGLTVREREERGERKERRDEGRERREKREKGRDKREERGEWVPRATWTPCQQLTVNLIPFDHFNGLSYDMG